jgi:hypothetical protein
MWGAAYVYYEYIPWRDYPHEWCIKVVEQEPSKRRVTRSPLPNESYMLVPGTVDPND